MSSKGRERRIVLFPTDFVPQIEGLWHGKVANVLDGKAVDGTPVKFQLFKTTPRAYYFLQMAGPKEGIGL